MNAPVCDICLGKGKLVLAATKFKKYDAKKSMHLCAECNVTSTPKTAEEQFDIQCGAVIELNIMIKSAVKKYKALSKKKT